MRAKVEDTSGITQAHHLRDDVACFVRPVQRGADMSVDHRFVDSRFTGRIGIQAVPPVVDFQALAVQGIGLMVLPEIAEQAAPQINDPRTFVAFDIRRAFVRVAEPQAVTGNIELSR